MRGSRPVLGGRGGVSPLRYSSQVWLVLLLVALLAASAQAETKLVYWTHSHDPAIPVNEKLIEEFEASHPDVDVVYDHVPHADYETKLLTSFAAGAGPDVYWIGDWVMPQFIPQGMADVVDPKAFGVRTQEEVEALFEPGALDAFKYEGQIYTAGISEYNTFSLLYNKAAFREAGIPLPSETDPMSYAEFIDAAKKLTVYEGGKRVRSGFEFVYNTPIWTILITEPWIRQLGGEFVDPSTGMPQFDSEPVVQVFQHMQDLVFKHETSAPSFVLDVFDDFANERIAMTIAGPWAMFVRDINPDLDLGIAPLPVFDGGQRATTLYSWAWLVNPNTENRELAWEFAAHVATSDPDAWWNKVNYLQPLNGRLEELSRDNAWLKPFVDDYAYGEYEFRSPSYYELSNILNRTLTSVMSEEVDVRRALENAQREARMVSY